MYGIDDAVDVVIGEKNIAIINRDGTVYITGSNETGVLGNGEVWSTGSANNGYNRTIPLPVLDTDMKALTGVVNGALGNTRNLLMQKSTIHQTLQTKYMLMVIIRTVFLEMV